MDFLGLLFDHLFEILGWVSGIFLLYGLALVIDSHLPAKAAEGDKAAAAPAPAPARLDPPVYID